MLTQQEIVMDDINEEVKDLKTALSFCWKGFDDIEDDARVLLMHAAPELHAMILGIRDVATHNRRAIEAKLEMPSNAEIRGRAASGEAPLD